MARDIPSLAYEISSPAIHLRSTSEDRRTRIGGQLPQSNGLTSLRESNSKIPFLAALDMEELQNTLKIDWLPPTGTLLFFYDHNKQEAWGFNPEDRKYFGVEYSEIRLPLEKRGGSAKASAGLEVFPLKASIMQSVPSWERGMVHRLKLTDDETDAWIEVSLNTFGHHARHQVGGYPSPIQSDEMELECQLVTHGLNCGSPQGYQDPRADKLKAGRSDWRLLLQIDSDEDAGLMWGDIGTVYFWIKEEDAKAKRFENAWMILQCH